MLIINQSDSGWARPRKQ